MDSEKMNQLSKAIEAKLSGILPEIGQVLQEYGISEPFEIVLTTNSISSRNTGESPLPGECYFDPQRQQMICNRLQIP